MTIVGGTGRIGNWALGRDVRKALTRFSVRASVLVVAALCGLTSNLAVGQMRMEADFYDGADADDDSDLTLDDIEQLQGVAPLAPNEPLRPATTAAPSEGPDSA